MLNRGVAYIYMKCANLYNESGVYGAMVLGELVVGVRASFVPTGMVGTTR